MGLTTLGICNRALTKLGVETITSLSGTSKQAELCNLVYDDMRDDLLISHPWNFAIKRATLALLSSTPTYEWSQEFQLPTDYLRILKCGIATSDISYAIENGVLRCNSEKAYVKYIAKIITPAQFSRSFAEALSWKIAAELVYSLVQDPKVQANIVTLADDFISRARVMDAQEGTPEQFFSDTWIESRYSLDNGYQGIGEVTESDY